MTLVDSLRLESTVELSGANINLTAQTSGGTVGYLALMSDDETKRNPDLLSSVHFLETMSTNLLVSLSSESC